jgi:hypothetical protein
MKLIRKESMAESQNSAVGSEARAQVDAGDLARESSATRDRARDQMSTTCETEDFFVLVATAGAHEFFSEEGGAIRDFRRDSLHFAGYSVGWKKGRDGKGHASVRLHLGTTASSGITLLSCL